MLKQVTKKAGFVMAIAGAAVIGGAATAIVQAAIPSSTDGQIHACYRNNASLTDAKGALRVIDSDANQSCSGQETALNLKQTSLPILKDANGQVVGDFIVTNHDNDTLRVFNHVLNRELIIDLNQYYISGDVVLANPENITFESSDCTGQKYTTNYSTTVNLKTGLIRWFEPGGTKYGIVADNATGKMVVDESYFVTDENGVTTCAQLSGQNPVLSYPLSEVSLPFSALQPPFRF